MTIWPKNNRFIKKRESCIEAIDHVENEKNIPGSKYMNPVLRKFVYRPKMSWVDFSDTFRVRLGNFLRWESPRDIVLSTRLFLQTYRKYESVGFR